MCKACKIYRVRNKLGLHTRVATLVAKQASRYHSAISIKKGKIQAKATSVLELLQLCAPCNTELEVIAIGSDAQEAVEAIGELFTREFEEAI